MTKQQIQAKLDQLTEIANELNDEAKRRYGPDGFLFFEADGAFHIMDGDEPVRDSVNDRQRHIKFSSRKYCAMGAGAW